MHHLVLAVAAFLLNRAQQRREQTIATANRAQDLQIAQDNRAQDQKIADDRQQEAVLDAYLGQMATLLLDKKLREQQGARQVARAQTLTALRRLNGTRRGAVVDFLYEAQLIGYPARDEHGIITTHSPIIALWKADLSEADLRIANLGEATVTNEQLNDAWSLAGATLPDGTRLPDDFKGPLPPRKTSAPSGTPLTPSPTASSSPPTPPDASQVP